jgi:hypothetical protein
MKVTRMGIRGMDVSDARSRQPSKRPGLFVFRNHKGGH